MNTSLQRRWLSRSIPAPKHGPRTRLAAQTARPGDGLPFTGWLFMGVLGLAYLFAMSTPIFAFKLHVSGISHFPFVLMCVVLGLHLVGMGLNRASLSADAVLQSTWPLVALGLFAFVGSALARWQFDVVDTYLTFAAYLLLLPLYAWSVPASLQGIRSWVRALIAVWIVSSIAALAGEAARIGYTETLHEIEYLVVSGFFIMFYVARSTALRLLSMMLLIAAAVLNQKLTGYIVALLAVIHMLVDAGWQRLLPQWRGAYAVAALVVSVAVVSVLTLLYFEFRQYLPSGNVQVRMAQYAAAWNQFQASPIWGNAYLSGSGEVYTEYLRALSIPTHSDLLDMLKHGGLIGFSLFVWGYAKIFLLVTRARAATQGDHLLHAYFTGVRFFQATALVTFAINPLLLRGPFLIVIWCNLGLATGIAMTVLAERRRAAAST